MTLSAEQRRALRVLAKAGPRGLTEAMLMAHGFPVDLLASFARDLLATATPERVWAAWRRVEVTRYRITSRGRKAIEG